MQKYLLIKLLLLLFVVNNAIGDSQVVYFNNATLYEDLLPKVRRAYRGPNAVRANQSLYLYNKETGVVFRFDSKLYYTHIGYQDAQDTKPENMFKLIQLSNENYSKLPGDSAKYDKYAIEKELRITKQKAFTGQGLKNQVDDEVRAVALLAEAARFQAIHTALKDGKSGIWNQSWGIIAHNWEKMAGTPATTVSIRTTCEFFKHHVNPETRKLFAEYINPKLGKKRCRNLGMGLNARQI